ncbi:iron-sulfur cluster biosynthesis family protein [Bacillus aquiflavi]|uniref:Iron-sulfur cluster biosynthesis family protein n=1 Tax=Bacillus aquiflavi TaxID=2672567 RepID=A0A6B3W3M3_9BACI|nr:iron-sulfur cluster biosynthesis family protein [Bacillus aquiflavi]MBA4538197.1 iron-sulfur cluster biosynthesis family protein [Bacillus aquiflavi]NEY82516.1 iron-sulfur cluster biosynthesis family protein [Bacillus aquiflavi]UAC47158.1 iron-sulfur cluster biosynthesis family protein [Bacillus aquiflavi]
MEITLTKAAIEKLAEKSVEQRGYVKLEYDTDGCECDISGVTVLSLVNELSDDDIEVRTNSIPIYVEKSREMYFDEEMTVDFSEAVNCFQLKSPNQILNGRMSFKDYTKN